MEGLPKSKITHDVESGKIVHSNHVTFLLRVGCNIFFQSRDELVSVLDKKWFLLFESTIRESRCEDLAHTTVVRIAGLEKIVCFVRCRAVLGVILLRRGSAGSLGTMAIDLQKFSGLETFDKSIVKK